MAATNEKVLSGDMVSLTIRLVMQGKEVGSIIGKKGEIVKRFRDESGAKINISDGSCPERIVTVTGNTDSIYKAFKLICTKFEEDLANLISPNTVPKPPITFKLIVPASQCGSLIGKGGSKIKEIRENTGASIQVASEMLPNSTERAVTISGGSEAITQCIYNICSVMSESPPKGKTVPYFPMKSVSLSSGGLSLNSSTLTNSQSNYLPTNTVATQITLNGANNLVPVNQAGKLTSLPLSGLSSLNGLGAFTNGALNQAALAALTAHRPGATTLSTSTQQIHEMTVPNELIGCIIGKGGSKIAEIRQLSGAMIRISNCEERSESGNNMDRTITISGNAECVALAQYLINMSMELYKANLLEAAAHSILPNGSPIFSSGRSLALSNPSYFLLPKPNINPIDLNGYLTAICNQESQQQLAGPLFAFQPPRSSSPSLYQVTPKLKSPCSSSSSLNSVNSSGGPKGRTEKFTPY